MKNKVTIICKECCHVMDVSISHKQEIVIEKSIKRNAKVCPLCGGSIVIIYGETVFNPSKPYKCKKGHLALVALLGEKFVNISYHDDTFCNMEEFDNKCNCGEELVEIDDFVPICGSAPAVKTKTRVGEIWDKKGIEPVRSGTYTKNGDYIHSRSQELNQERMRKMRKQRNIQEEMLPGRAIKNPTKRDYGYRSKESLDQ